MASRNCREGLAISFWLEIIESLSKNPNYGHQLTHVASIEGSFSFYINLTHICFSIMNVNDICVATLWRTAHRNITNFGFIWIPGKNDFASLINGIAARWLPAILPTQTLLRFTPILKIGRDGTQSKEPQMAFRIRDLVIWKHKLYDFEANRFLGISRMIL